MADSAGPSPGRIFISYRREETAYPAGWLFDRLADRFGGQVFKDVDSIELGDDFVEVITGAVGSCDVLLALIGDQWLTITNEDGRRRLDDPDDFVRLEIEAALTRNVRVIPILVDGARMPRAADLPPSLAKLVRRQALELSPARFDFDTSRLLRVLDKTLADVRTAQEHAAGISVPADKAPDLTTTEPPVAPDRQRRAESGPPRSIPPAAAAAPTGSSPSELSKPLDRGMTEIDEGSERRESAEPTLMPSAGPAARARYRDVVRDGLPVSQPSPATGEAGPPPSPTVPAPPATAAPADRRARPSGRARAPRRRLPLVIAAGIAAVVVAAAAVIAAQQLRRGASTPSAPGTATPKAAGQLRWERLTEAALGGPGDQRMNAVTRTFKQDPSYLAGGFTTSSGDRDAAIWISQDGRNWERIADKDLGGPGDQVVSTVAEYRGTLMAVGSDTSAGDSDIAAWESSDGRAWDRVASDLREPGSQRVNRVRSTGQGLLTAGSETRGDGDDDAVIWRYQSAPAGWDRISDRSFEGPGRQVVWRVVEADLGYGTSYIAAGGSAGQTSGGEDAAVWISSDLRTWEPVKDRSLGGAGDQEITDLDRFGSGLIAVGVERRSGGTRGLVWLSDDGRTWTRVGAPAMTGLGPDGMLTRVIPDADAVGKGVPKLITAGFSGTTAALDAAIWTSQTGKTWTREAVFSGPGNQEILSLARTQTGVIAVGEATSKQGSDAAVWVGIPRQ